MTNEMEESPLWKRTFAEPNNPNVTRLVTSLRVSRERVGQLTSRVAASLPSLTMHDLSHLDALWTVAGTIAGEDFHLNPLEGYLFGSAVLLHDAALCFEAYSGGQQAVRDTVEWRDAYNRCLGAQGRVDTDSVDFEALRSLHAARGGSLATEPWESEQEGPQYIIEDEALRTQYGPLIGEIASSHHWKIDHVAERFPVPRPPAAFLPQGWTVDPLKVACLLRAADAGHMDSSRAPAFLLKILEMNSISKAHWVAQNHLGQLTVKDDDPTQLVVASTAPFRAAEAEGWWVAFDLVAQLDKELKQCDAILATPSAYKRSFARKRVAAAGNARELAKYIQTDGWETTDSTVHVSDVTALVNRLGGEQLYGAGADRLMIALRELVQNSADAISARRLFSGRPSFKGQIRIRLRRAANRRYVLQVDDDGVGMSAATLSDDLLDFGKSFWASERASREFPGLHAAGHSPRGRFGIGFFSVFMAASSVQVFSRRFDKGLEDVRCLSFDNGLSLRPTLTARKPMDLGMDVCTRVELVLKPELIADPNRIEIKCNVFGHKGFHVPFMSYVAALVSGIDSPISVEMDDALADVHKGFPPRPTDRADWLRTLAYVSAGVNRAAAALVDEVTPRLREIRDGNICHGLAAIRVGQAGPCDFLSAKSVGGFAVHDVSASFVGLIHHLPDSAKREPGKIAAPKTAVDVWLLEQVGLLHGRLSPVESVLASYSLCDFDYDPIDVLQGIRVITTNGKLFWHLRDLSAMLRAGNRLGFRVADYGTPRLEVHGEQHSINGFATCYVFKNGKFNAAETSATGPTQPTSLVGVIHRVLVAHGAEPTWTTTPNMYQGPFSRCGCLEVRI